MSWVTHMLTSSIGRKYVMAITGLFLCSFLVVHWSGNMLLFLPDEGNTFNKFTYFMESNIIIKVMEYVLFAGFIIHILQSYAVTRQNQKARPVKYAVSSGDSNSKWYSRSMGILGSLILIFLVIHMRHFWFDLRFEDHITEDEVAGVVNLYPAVVAMFHIWYVVLIYVAGVLSLGYHLWHGFPSAFRSFGIMHKQYTPAIIMIGKVYTIIITAGFFAMPVYFFFSQFMNN
jgi:succinate dehydrogenase / fumarate reductase cytochrome b subunit